MQTVLKYLSKTFTIGEFSILLKNAGRCPDYYLPCSFDAYISKPQKEVDYTLSLSGQPVDTKKNINGVIFYEDNNILFDSEYSSDSRITLRVRPDWKNWEVVANQHKSPLEWMRPLGNIFAFSIINQGAIMLHSAVVEYNGMGILISAASGIGKTTHSRLWRDHRNALIINGDRGLCRKVNEEWYVYGSPWSGSSGESINRRAPIKAVVLLERGSTNKVTSLSQSDALIGLLPRLFAPDFDSILASKALDTLGTLIKEVPILKLQCLPNLEAVEVLEKALLSL